MRKIILIILAAATALITGCGNSRFSGENSGGEPISESQVSAELESKSINEPTNSDSTSADMPTIIQSSLEQSSMALDNSQISEQTTDREKNDLSITITVNGRTFSATLYDNETARAFRERLPLTLEMSELNGNEKYYYLPDSLPRNSSRPSAINAGDIMLYGDNCIVIFYESFSTSYSYTPIGKIDNPDGLAAALGSGNVHAAFD